jgi:hypothetical protein
MNLTEEVNRNCVEWMLKSADVALTFVAIAETTKDESHRNKAVQDARRAYHGICQRRPQLTFADMETRALDMKLEQLKSRLRQIGLQTDAA